jgi:DNA-directed RNA polymerase subunit A"
MAQRGVTPDIIYEKLLNIKAFILELNRTKEGITIAFETPSYRKIYQLNEHIKVLTLKGVSGIKRAIVRRDKAKNEWVIYTQGSNLADILKIDGVCKKRTVTNDIVEIYNVLGVEAARKSIIHEALHTLNEQGLSVDTRHIMLVADMMTFDGKVEAIGRHGISGKKTSVLARAAFEITARHLLEAGLTGETDLLNGVAENIIVGQPVALGTGAIPLIYKPNKEK